MPTASLVSPFELISSTTSLVFALFQNSIFIVFASLYCHVKSPHNNKENTLKYIIASTCSHCLLKVTSLSNYIEYIFSKYSKNNLRLIRRLFPHQITYGQLSLLVNSLSLFWPIPKYTEASLSVKFAFSHNGIYFLSITITPFNQRALLIGKIK